MDTVPMDQYRASKPIEVRARAKPLPEGPIGTLARTSVGFYLWGGRQREQEKKNMDKDQAGIDRA